MWVRGSWRPNRTAIYWPPLLWPSALSFSFSKAAQPEAQGPRGPALCWMMAFFTASYHQLVSKTPSGIPSPFGLVWLSLPHLVSNSAQSLTVWLLVLTKLYNSSTSTQSPTQSLEWHVWSSSSGNNWHAVHRSLSSGVSLYGLFTLSHFISQIRPRDLFRLLAIGMCHFLPVYQLGMACLPGPKVKIQHLFLALNTTQYSLLKILNFFGRKI